MQRGALKLMGDGGVMGGDGGKEEIGKLERDDDEGRARRRCARPGVVSGHGRKRAGQNQYQEEDFHGATRLLQRGRATTRGVMFSIAYTYR